MVNQIIVVYLTLLLGIPTGADWTMYFDVKVANYTGDRELIAHVFEKFPRFMCEDPVRMQVKMYDSESTHLTRGLFSTDSAQDGFLCLNVNHSNSVCENYQVRYCCPGGHGAKWCLIDEELQHHPPEKIYSIAIRENTKVDEEVWRIPFDDILGSGETSIHDVAIAVDIVHGNKNNRFSVSENNSSVILASLLDADILSLYSLVIHLTFTNGVSPLQPFQILMHGLSTTTLISHYNDAGLLLNNSECNVQGFGAASRKFNEYDFQELEIKFKSEGSNTFHFDYTILQNDDPVIQQLGITYNIIGDYLFCFMVRGVNSHGQTKFTFEIRVRDSGKVLIQLNTPIEVKALGCPQSRYGARCQYKCDCKTGAACHMWNGACKCKDGWRGPACDIPMKANAILDSQEIVEDPTPMYSEIQLLCSVTNMDVESVVWKLNQTILRKPQTRILNGIFDDDSLYVLSIRNLTQEDSGLYKCILSGNQGTVESNDFKLRVKGCKPNTWGENCDRWCDCVNAFNCTQDEGCVCEAGWVGRHCHLDIQPPKIHDCPNDITVSSDSDGIAFVTWISPNVTDNAGPPSISSNYISGQEFYIGSTVVAFNVSDGYNHVYCSFTVTVLGAPSTTNRLMIIMLITAGIIFITALVTIYFICGRKTRRNPLYVPLHDVLLLPEMIPKIDLIDLIVLQQIGQGEFSQVKSGKLYNTKENAQDVAIKILKGNNMEAQYTFREECERLNDLKGHQNIIQLIGVVVESGKKYIVTELMDSDLLNVLTALNMTGVVNLITDRRFVKFSLGIARALEHMEKMKIVHRDIAARNILISHEDIAKVGDFGFARDVYQMGEYHRYQRRPGRFPTRWMAPESLQDKIYTSKSDIWSYGILMWEIANLGASPNYPDVDDVNAKTLSDHLLQGCRLPRSRNCSVEIFRLMNRCWYNQARDRCSAGVIAEELSQYVDADRGFFFQEAG
ncbi:fibroblast growth factor receptor-like [Ptychodera flava]|uniref:fibroblast growth factor receptor-like n=1 Tax=Ptychodera flava TaxID=63121 RepID=UPI003969CFAE